jgi:hypothetical protein
MVLPFPIKRRRDLIRRQSAYAASLNESAAKRHIAIQIKIQVDAMRRRGIAENLVQREAQSMRLAIRSHLRR